MNRRGFIDYVARNSTENSGKTKSYDTAILILDNVLKFQNRINLRGKSLYEITDESVLEEVLKLVKEEVVKMKAGKPNIFDHGNPNQKSYPLNSFCSAALKNLLEYNQLEKDVVEANIIVKGEKDPQVISKKLLNYFDITKEGEDKIYESKHRKGQEYFRRMILANYGGRCALTGIDIPQVLLASHIIPWSDAEHHSERLNPSNGICLSALYDKAFDKGLITFSPDDYSVCLSSLLRDNESKDYYDHHFGCIVGKKLTIPEVFKPNRDFLAYHREKVFVGL